MRPTIAAIETWYAGCRFRSRLEARWAVFFDALAIPWWYEPQGVVIDDKDRYLPDFWLPHQNLFYEVKGAPPGPEVASLLERLADASGRRVILAIGDIPRPDDYEIECEPPSFFMESFWPEGWDNYQAWCRCDDCGATNIQFMGRAERNCKCHSLDHDRLGAHHPDILNAYRAARAARFEHGEGASYDRRADRLPQDPRRPDAGDWPDTARPGSPADGEVPGP